MNRMDKYKKLILALFFLSGSCGLIYEVLWVRMLTLIFGATTYATSVVLASFMSGLAVGSWYFGKLVDSKKFSVDSFRLYGYLMLFTGLYCAFTPVLFRVVDKIYILLVTNNNGSQFMIHGLRFLLTFVIILVPTALMGGTLPVLTAGIKGQKLEVNKSSKDIDHLVGLLYSVNTWGAVLGVFLTGYILIVILGVKGTLYLASVINFAIGGVVFILAKGAKMNADIRPAATTTKNYQPSTFNSQLILMAIGLSGFTALAYEVLWTRTLNMILGSSTYAFTTMLCSFLVGIALGSLIYTRFSHLISQSLNLSISSFGFIQAGIGISVLLLIPVFGILPFVFLKLFKPFGSAFIGIQFIQFVIGFIVMLIPTTLFGMTIPLACKIYSGNVVRPFRVANSEAKSSRYNIGIFVGNVYSANTIGAILGSLLAGFALIPWLGIQKSITIVALVNITLSIFMLFLGLKEKRFLRYATVSFLLFFTIPYVLALPRWNKNIITGGSYVYGPSQLRILENFSLTGLKDILNREKLLYYKEGAYFTVSVKQSADNNLFMAIDGKTDASTRGDMSNQLLTGYLPVILHPNPKKVFLLGLASGVSLGAIQKFEFVEKIECAEIESSMLEVVKLFSKWNNLRLDDQRIKIVINDGRNYLTTTNKKFNIIISEPTNIWVGGQANLVTRDFFELCKNRLENDGLMCQWMGFYKTTNEDLKIAIKTFVSVFPYTTLWIPYRGGDLLLIGSQYPLELDFNKIDKKCKVIESELEKIGLDSTTILGLFLMSPEQLKHFVESVSIHTDNFPYLEFSAPKYVYNDGLLLKNLEILFSNAEPISPYLTNRPESFDRKIMEFYESRGSYFQVKKLAEFILKENPDDKKAINCMGYWYLTAGDINNARNYFNKALELDPQYIPAIGNLSQIYLTEGNISEAISLARKVIQIDPYSPDGYNNLGMIYLKINDYVQMKEMFQKAIRTDPQYSLAYYNLGRYYLKIENSPEIALDYLLQAYNLNRDIEEIYLLLAEAYHKLNKPDKTQEMLWKAEVRG